MQMPVYHQSEFPIKKGRITCDPIYMKRLFTLLFFLSPPEAAGETSPQDRYQSLQDQKHPDHPCHGSYTCKRMRKGQKSNACQPFYPSMEI